MSKAKKVDSKITKQSSVKKKIGNDVSLEKKVKVPKSIESKNEKKVISDDIEIKEVKKVKSNEKIIKSKDKNVNSLSYATGKRKNSIAKVRVFTSSEVILEINGKKFEEYCPRLTIRSMILSLFPKLENCTYKFVINVSGGGIIGQMGAIKLGIARALSNIDESYHKILSQNGYLTRDARIVERKKPGLRKARKREQFSKR